MIVIACELAQHNDFKWLRRSRLIITLRQALLVVCLVTMATGLSAAMTSQFVNAAIRVRRGTFEGNRTREECGRFRSGLRKRALGGTRDRRAHMFSQRIEARPTRNGRCN